MNALLSSLLDAPAWFVAVLNLSFQAAILCALVFIVTKTLGRWIPPNWRALLWFIVIARVLIPFSPPSAFSLQNLWTKSPPPAIVATPISFPTSSPQEFPAVFESNRFIPPPAPRRLPIGLILSGIWAAGSLACLSVLAFRSLLIRRRLNQQIPTVPEELQPLLKSHYPIRITTSDQLAAPALTGLFPARLILPANFADQFTPAQLRHILRHELAHIQQGHLLLHWLALIARSVHWFNPFIHIAAARLRHECELAADAAALKNSSPTERAAYGETILAVLAQATAPRTSLALAMAAETKNIQHRLRALTQPAARSFRPLGALLLVALTVSGFSSADTSPQPTPQKPSAPPPATKAESVPDAISDESIPAAKKIQNARLLIELGKLDEAERFLKNAAKTEPENRAIFYYLNLIKQQRSARSSSIERLTREAASPNQVHTSPKRRELYGLLDKIRIDEFPLPKNTDLIEVLRMLKIAESKQRQPGDKGINILITQAADRPARKPESDFLPEQPSTTPAADVDVDVEKFQVKFDPPIHDVTLRQLLDAIVAVARPPEGAPPGARLKYSVEDYAVIFSQRAWESVQLFTRTFRLDPNTFKQGLEGVTFSPSPFQGVVTGSAAGSGPAQDAHISQQGSTLSHVTTVTNLSTIQSEVRAFFSAAGLDFPTNPPGAAGFSSQSKALFYNDRLGVLFVRAPLADLDKIENILHLLNASGNAAPPAKSP
jgi:beta-lactamase regulating signal transducer with metallopeptidase domain